MTPTITEIESLSSLEICELAGISFRQLDYWDRAGILSPMSPAQGSGSRRRYGADQARLAWSVRKLMALDAGAEVAAKAAAQLESHPERFGYTVVVTKEGELLEPMRAILDGLDGWMVNLEGAP